MHFVLGVIDEFIMISEPCRILAFQDGVELALMGSYFKLKTTSYKYHLAIIAYRFLHHTASTSVLTNGVLLPA